MIDESEVLRKKIHIYIIGELNVPSKGNVTSQIIYHSVKDVIRFIGISRENFFLLLSNAARYAAHSGCQLKGFTLIYFL